LSGTGCCSVILGHSFLGEIGLIDYLVANQDPHLLAEHSLDVLQAIAGLDERLDHRTLLGQYSQPFEHFLDLRKLMLVQSRLASLFSDDNPHLAAASFRLLVCGLPTGRRFLQ
jgi:hypothetical protein